MARIYKAMQEENSNKSEIEAGRSLTRRQFLTGAGAAALSLPFINVERVFASQERPNFVFILTDDQRWDAMSCAGHPFLRTPNIDRIAKEGARFTNAFVTTALCSPSRASILTGRYAHFHGVINNKTPLSDDIPTFPQALQKAGYDTAYIGKWHMDGQEGPRPGFNRWMSFKGQGRYDSQVFNVNGETVPFTGYITDILTRSALEWLKQPRKSPFCLYLAHKSVHAPFTPAIRHSKLYSDAKIPRPATMNDDLKGKPKWLAAYQQTRMGVKDAEKFEQFVRNYNRCLVSVDEGVGKVMAALDDLGVLDNTVVVFMGDNGFFQGEHGLLDKRAMYEESIRVPILMRYPRLVKPGTPVNGIALNIDICPTFLELAGAKLPDGVQGRSLLPLLKGRRSGWRTDFLYEYFPEPGFAVPEVRGVRGERWKYIEYPGIADTAELYDLKNDVVELHNLIGDASAEKELASLRGRLRALMEETK